MVSVGLFIRVEVLLGGVVVFIEIMDVVFGREVLGRDYKI